MIICPTKVIVIIILILIIQSYFKKTEGFSQKEIEIKAKEIFSNRQLFKPNVKYSKIKNNIKWVDPVLYNDIYKLSLKENLSISNLENTLYNGIM